MPFTVEDARRNMNKLIEKLDEKLEELENFVVDPPNPDQEAELLLRIQHLNIEIKNRRQVAEFNAASATVIRPPTATEVSELQKTLEFMGRKIDSFATFSAAIRFVNEVVTKNSQRFLDIFKTIRTS